MGQKIFYRKSVGMSRIYPCKTFYMPIKSCILFYFLFFIIFLGLTLSVADVSSTWQVHLTAVLVSLRLEWGLYWRVAHTKFRRWYQSAKMVQATWLSRNISGPNQNRIVRDPYSPKSYNHNGTSKYVTTSWILISRCSSHYRLQSNNTFHQGLIQYQK
jgi:hypothetical protein